MITTIASGPGSKYLMKKIEKVEIVRLFNPEFDPENKKVCVCGHHYSRHFDWTTNMHRDKYFDDPADELGVNTAIAKTLLTWIILMTDHECRRPRYCICSSQADEPDEECYIHGSGEWPPRCAICGKFLKWRKDEE